MTRDLTAGMVTQVTADALAPIYLFEGLFDSGALRFWTGYGSITWNGVEWTGAGDLIGISDLTESQELKAVGASITLSGMPSELIAVALLEEYQGRDINVYLGAMQGSQIVADPYLLFGGIADVMAIEEAGETASITMTVESRLIDLERARLRRYEHEDQQLDFAGDLGFEYVPTLQDKAILFGRKG